MQPDNIVPEPAQKTLNTAHTIARSFSSFGTSVTSPHNSLSAVEMCEAAPAAKSYPLLARLLIACLLGSSLILII